VNQGGEGRGKKDKSDISGIVFLISITVLYVLLYLVLPEKTTKALNASGSVFLSIVPVLLLVIFLMGFLNHFLRPKWVRKHLGEGSGAKGWSLAIATGILSHGPIYIWFPVLKDMREHGMGNGLIAAFIYNRAIKLPLLPVMIYYFGLLFVSVLMVLMVAASIVQGLVVERLMDAERMQ